MSATRFHALIFLQIITFFLVNKHTRCFIYAVRITNIVVRDLVHGCEIIKLTFVFLLELNCIWEMIFSCPMVLFFILRTYVDIL